MLPLYFVDYLRHSVGWHVTFVARWESKATAIAPAWWQPSDPGVFPSLEAARAEVHREYVQYRKTIEGGAQPPDVECL